MRTKTKESTAQAQRLNATIPTTHRLTRRMLTSVGRRTWRLSKGWFASHMSPLPPANTSPVIGSLDGDGAADPDQPYRFGFRPRASAPYPFNTRQYARLLVLRSRIQDHGLASRSHTQW